MNIDKIDINIIRKLSEYGEDEEITTTQLVKDVMNPNDREEMINYNSLLTSKLKKLIGYGIISTEEMDDGKSKFYISEKDAICENVKLELDRNGDSVKFNSDNTVIIPKDGGVYAIMFIEED